MDVRLFDLDGGVVSQSRLRFRSSQTVDLRVWGSRLRLACGWDAYRRFEIDLARRLGTTRDSRPAVTFVGSGDFHHVSLALVRRLARPCNLLVLDNHPDWMRGVPMPHCGTWLYHAAKSPMVKRIFHVGGEIDFDNAYRWLAPWEMLRSGKIVVLPARRTFNGSGWSSVPHQILRPDGAEMTTERIDDLLTPWKSELASLPLYVSLDRDVIRKEESVSNWDHGHLTAREVLRVLRRFVADSAELVGMDVVGDCSLVQTQGLMRTMLHWLEHERKVIDPVAGREVNEPVNLAILDAVS